MNNMISLLSDVRAYLAQRYKDELGQTLHEARGEAHITPAWELINGNDLRSPADPSASKVAGVLVDRELGLVLFFIPFVAHTDLRAQVVVASKFPLNPPADENDTWQITIHWLVEDSNSTRESWETQMVQLRQQTRFSEELILDAVFFRAGELRRSLNEHGLPRLLFTTRRVLSQRHHSEAAQWMSADHELSRELQGFRDQFTAPEQRQRAELIEQRMGEILPRAGRIASATASGADITSVEVRDFRNLGHVRLHFGRSPVSCRVIHGPNGTGKTSLFEALSLALCSSSTRYQAFLSREERDVSAGDRRGAYLAKYLTPFDRPNRSPRVGLNGNEPTALQLVDSWEEAHRVDLDFNGNLLAQETTQEFLQMSSEDLAVRILTGYSEFAEQLEAFVDLQVEKATNRRQGFLRDLGLNTSITRIDTALTRITERILQQQLPAPPPSLLTCLNQLAEIPESPNDISQLRVDCRRCIEQMERARLAAELAASSESEQLFILENWLGQWNRLATRTRDLAQHLEEKLSPIRDYFDGFLQDLAAWGQWLERCPAEMAPAPRFASDLDLVNRQLAELQAAQQKAMRNGQATRLHLDHLDQVAKAIAQGLTAAAPNECPTCGAHHLAEGGVSKVVAELRQRVASAREDLLREYRALDEKVKNLQRTLQHRGEMPCPVSAERRAALEAALAWLLPQGTGTLETCLKDLAQRSRMLALLRALQTPLPQVSELDSAGIARRIVREISVQSSDARENFFDQEHWKPVQDAFRRKLTKVVKEHLPATLERLWYELWMNLTAAPWLLPGRPGFEIALKRGQQRALVRVGDRLARYILNQAETNLLGLGWFFVRYLTHGRFRCPTIVMDDPAQQLDNTSYRDLCRFWRVFARLHCVYKLPLRMILLLHQEDRALDAARATQGLVYVLNWSAEQEGTLRELEAVAPNASPSDPSPWFNAERVVA